MVWLAARWRRVSDIYQFTVKKLAHLANQRMLFDLSKETDAGITADLGLQLTLQIHDHWIYFNSQTGAAASIGDTISQSDLGFALL